MFKANSSLGDLVECSAAELESAPVAAETNKQTKPLQSVHFKP